MKRRRRMRTEPFSTEEIGSDSFLDTIANLVGVLIILVVVVGAQTQNGPRESPEQRELAQQIAATEGELREQREVEQAVRGEQDRIAQLLEAENRMLELRSAERQQALVTLQLLEDELTARRRRLADSEQQALQSADEIQQLYRQLADVQGQVQALRAESTTRETIEHFPTPIARTVFRDEVHFRLSEGRIAYVPLDDLLQMMKDEWRVQAEKLQNTSHLVETVGPLENFRLQYELSRRTVVQQTAAGPVRGEAVEFDRFVVLPTLSRIGEPLDEALAEGSLFRRAIDRLQADRHTISVWVYPDSYSEFNRLKRWLFEQGFPTATWPLSQGAPISGGPNGYRATAQ